MTLTTGTATSFITFSRASTATRINASGLVESVASGAARIDFDSTGSCRGLLIEEQRTNLLTYSEQFDNASWVKANVSVTPNTTIAPDGTLTADTVSGVTAGTTNYIDTRITGASSIYTFSFWVRAGTATTCAALLRDNTAGPSLSVSARILSGPGSISLAANPIIVISSLSSTEWTRVSLTLSSAFTAGNSLRAILYPETAFSASVTGKSNVFWGAQLEAGSFATSYIPTTSASVTRSADVAQVATSAFPYSASEGTLVLNWDQLSASAGVPLVSALSSGTSSNYIGCFSNPSSFLYAVVDGGVSQVSLTTGTVAANTAAKGGIVYKANDFAVSFNGGAVVTDTSGTVPAVSQMNIGSLNSSNFLNGHIRQITYIPRRLTNAELQARTA